MILVFPWSSSEISNVQLRCLKTCLWHCNRFKNLNPKSSKHRRYQYFKMHKILIQGFCARSTSEKMIASYFLNPVILELLFWRAIKQWIISSIQPFFFLFTRNVFWTSKTKLATSHYSSSWHRKLAHCIWNSAIWSKKKLILSVIVFICLI